MTNPDTTVTVLDPNHDDGTTTTVDLADPPDWLDVPALRAEALEAGDSAMVAAIDTAR